jgi:hypothetical protein
MVWRTPYYFRPPDYRYRLYSERGYGWWTGVVRGDQQLYLGPTAVLLFDRKGGLLRVEDKSLYPVPKEWRDRPCASAECSEAWPRELGFKEAVIEVKRFWLPELWIGVEDMPDTLAEFYTDPERFELEPGDVDSWKESDQYVFHAGCGDYYMNSEGGVETS